MIIQLRSRKAMFTTLVVGCVLIVCVISIADLRLIASQFPSIVFWEQKVGEKMQYLKSMWISNTSNGRNSTEQTAISSYLFNITPWESLTDQPLGKPYDGGNSLQNMSTTSTSLPVITRVNNSADDVTPEVIYIATTMTFNKSLVVHCKESPYIDCVPPNLTFHSGKVVHLGVLGFPKWFSTDICNPACCPVNACVVQTIGITMDTQIIMVYGVKLNDYIGPPPLWNNKTYVLALWESPEHTYADFMQNGNSPWNSRINLIMSYRLDGDVFSPYNRLRFNPKPLDKRPNYYEIAKLKTRTAVWIASHCKTHSKRELYVSKMQKYIDVDIFGECGRPCSYNNLLCYNWLSKYKFYLSFENSLCTDYITEKFFKLFDQSIFVIPVVRGGADYDKHFPNFTYINSAHFTTPKDLALHLKQLASDLETYSKYLEYKDLYGLIDSSVRDCMLCEFFHSQNFRTLKRHNLTSWIADGLCHQPTDL